MRGKEGEEDEGNAERGHGLRHRPGPCAVLVIAILAQGPPGPQGSALEGVGRPPPEAVEVHAGPHPPPPLPAPAPPPSFSSRSSSL
eukprot:615029-Pyramimonas_sp.AAC.1